VTHLELPQVADKEPILIANVIEEVLLSSKELIESQNATVRLDLGQDGVYATSSALSVIFQNLIVNAIQYRDPNRLPEIHIVSRQVGEMVEVKLTDNGRGIDLEKNSAKLFKIFTRLQHKAAGTGIGLYLVKRTVEKLGGNITVESQLGVGTTFVILLPQTKPL
jgi:signal transduction histidine kinase